MPVLDIIRKLKNRGPESEEEIRRKSLEFQAQNDPNMVEEPGLEEGDYLPGGVEDFVSPKGLGSKVSKVAGDFKNYEKTLKDGTKLMYKIPSEVFAKLKSFDVKALKPYLVDSYNKAVGATRHETIPMTKTTMSK